MDRYLLAEQLHRAYFEARNGPGNALPMRLGTAEERRLWVAVAEESIRALDPRLARELGLSKKAGR